MTNILLISGILLVVSVFSSKMLYKYGIPTLLIFLSLGMLLGSDGIGGIYFDNAILTQQISTVGLAFIMFYGGFGFNWNMGKPVAPQSIILATLGVVLTAFLVGVFSYLVFDISFLEGMLLGSVISSTDAASVFSILRSKKLNLKGGLASMLEMESGSNDPISYMLTIVVLAMLTNNGQISVVQLLSKQIIFGLAVGFAVALIAVYSLKRIRLDIDGLYPIYTIGLVLIGFSLSEWIGGNGLLAVYIIGIITGNSKFVHKRSLVHFFDGLSWLMQIILFFTLGLLVFPSQIPSVFIQGLAVAIFLVVVARPIAVMSILTWFKTPIKQQLLVSWVGLRGAASIVFATYALANNLSIANQIFNIVFFVCLFSILVQGTMIPTMARKLDLVEEEISVYKTFNDYQDEVCTPLIELTIEKDNPWAGKAIRDISIPGDILIVILKRKNEFITPKGSTVIKAGDNLVLSGSNIDEITNKLDFL